MTDYFDPSVVENEINSGSFDSNPVQPSQATGETEASPYDPNLIIPYTASGKDLNEPLSSVIKRAQQGYNYAQLVEQHKLKTSHQEAEYQNRQAQLQQLEQQWKPYHDYASQNPQWAEHVRQSWESRFAQPDNFYKDLSQAGNNQTQDKPNYSIPPELSQKISQMEQFIEGVKQREVNAQRAQEDQALAHEIDSIKKSYPDIDFHHTDPETGESLELKILRHAQEKQIHNFGAAFKDFYFDQLMERSVIKAKEDATKALTAQHKSGFLATSSKPLLTSSFDKSSPDLKNMSYHRLMDMAAQDSSIFS